MKDMKHQIDLELKEIHMSDVLKNTIRTKVYGRRSHIFAKNVAAIFAILMLGGTTVFAGYYLYNKVTVNDEVLPELDTMYSIQVNPLNMDTDEYGMIHGEFGTYNEIQEQFGITLLDSELSEDNPYILENIQTDNKDFAILTLENYILGDTKNYQYLPEENHYTFDHGTEFYSPISLTIDIMLSENQMNNGWDTDYLGMYKFCENYTSSQGYKVNLIEDTTGEDEVENYISEKCAIFVADGVRYTLKGRTSIETIKSVVDSMK